MRKVLFGASAMLATASAFAAAGDMPDSAAVSEIFTNAQTSLGDLLTAALPVIIAVVGGGLLVWGGIALVGVIKRAFGAGKGR